MISALVGCLRQASGGRGATTDSTRKLLIPIPARLLCGIHRMAIFGPLVAFLVAKVRKWCKAAGIL